MKYSEFEKEMNSLGFKVEHEEYGIVLRNARYGILLTLSKVEVFVIDSNFSAFTNEGSREKRTIIENAVKLASTPIEEREEEKQYRLKFENNLKEIYVLFNESTSDWTYYDNGKFVGNKNKKAIFTESELKDIDETGFVREEVTE
jgi:membrane peptidoglycan carboxypeptidase